VADDGIDVFIRWILHNGPTTERARAFLTLSAFLSSDERLARLWRADWLDERLAEEFLSFAEPEEVAALLAFRIGHQLSADLFKKAFDRALSATSDPNVVSSLISVGALYLRHHLDSFKLPYEPTQELLRSENLDDRIAGIRAIRYTEAPGSEILTAITAALTAAAWEEKWTGLCQLSQVLDEAGPSILLSANQSDLEKLVATLTHIEQSDAELDARRSAAHSRARLPELQAICPGGKKEVG
jgi:hypothetical protein